MKRWILLLFTVGFLSACGSMKSDGYHRKLISVADNSNVGNWSINNMSFPFSGTGAWSVSMKTLHGGSQEGVQVITVDNGKMSFTVIPTRGMSVGNVQSGDVKLAWDSPVNQIVHPKHVDLQDHGGLGWLTGFNEFMTRCGVSFAGHPGEDDGRMLTLHGRVGNIPASEVEVIIDKEAPHRIRIRGLVEEKMFKFADFELWTEISTVPGSKTFRIEDRLINKSSYAREYQIIYHTNFGRPLLGKDSKFVAAVKEVFPFDAGAAKDLKTWTTYLAPTSGYGEQVYCVTPYTTEKGRTTVMLHNAQATRGIAIRYQTKTLPGFTLWKNTDTEEEGYVTGLEPGTGFPYNRSVERAAGRVKKLKPGKERRFVLTYQILGGKTGVAKVAAEIKALQKGRPTKVVAEPPAKLEPAK
jgi:hypothetical protein